MNTQTLQEIPWEIKLIMCIIWDILDFTIFRIPAFGTFADFVSGFLAIGLFGSTGVFAFWELLDVTDQVDGFIPTMTIIAIMDKYLNPEEQETVRKIGGRALK